MIKSRLTRKRCSYPDGCNNFPIISGNGRCSHHLTAATKEKNLTKKKKTVVSEKSSRVNLKVWFNFQMTNNNLVCDNCKTDLLGYTYQAWKDSQHHIVDKALVPSVASNINNHLVLGIWCCHSQWHTNFLNASRMPVFEKAREKFLLFKDEISPLELHKVNPYLFP